MKHRGREEIANYDSFGDTILNYLREFWEQDNCHHISLQSAPIMLVARVSFFRADSAVPDQVILPASRTQT